MKTRAVSVAGVLGAMHAAGIFYARHHRYYKPTLARMTEKGRLAAVPPHWLQKWIAERFGEQGSRDLYSAVQCLPLDGFPVVTDETAALI